LDKNRAILRYTFASLPDQQRLTDLARSIFFWYRFHAG
jgi:hypothetical protein